MKFKNAAQTLTIALLTIMSMGMSFGVNAAVTAFFRVGNTCTGLTSDTYAPSGTTKKLALCLNSDAGEKVCGFSAFLKTSTSTGAGRFNLTARTLGTSYPDAATTFGGPYAINSVPSMKDMGGIVSNINAPALVGTNQLLAVFDVTPTAAAILATQNFSTTVAASGVPGTSVEIDTDGKCTSSITTPISASISLTLQQ